MPEALPAVTQPFLLKAGGSSGQPLGRRIRPQVIVLGECLHAFAGLDLDRHDFFLQPPVLPRTIGELLTAKRVAVLLLTRHTILCGTVFCSRRHRAAAVGVEQGGPERVFELALAKAESGPKAADHVRCLAHALHAAREHDVRLVEQDHLRTTDGRLNAGSTQPVDRQRGDFDRQAGLQAHMTRTVDSVRARLHDVAKDDVVYRLRRHAGTLHCRARSNRPELNRRKVLELARVVRHGRARAAQDVDVFDHRLPHCSRGSHPAARSRSGGATRDRSFPRPPVRAELALFTRHV